MRLARTAVIFWTLLLPVSAGAVDVDLGVRSEFVYDSNVFRSDGKERDDGSFRIAPTIAISQETARLRGSIAYTPNYEAFFTYTDANALTHFLYGSASYLPTDTTQIDLVNTFRIQEVLNFFDPNTIDEGTPVVPDNDIERERVTTNYTALNISHVITPRLNSNTAIMYNYFSSARRNSVDSNTISGSQDFSYGLTAFDTVGVGGSVTVQMFDEVLTLPASNTYVYQVYGIYRRNFGESTTLSLRAGPAFIRTDQDNPSNYNQAMQYPGYIVDQDTTVGQLRNQGYPIAPAPELDPSIDDATLVPAGSAIVPYEPDCIDGFVAPVYFEGNRCRLQTLLRNDITQPDEFAPLQSVATAPPIDIDALGNNGADNRFTIFARVGLDHRWTPTLSSSIGYVRRESTASGQGTSTIADSVSLFTRWLPSELWDLSVRANYVKRQSPNDLSRTYAVVQSEFCPTCVTLPLVSQTGVAQSVTSSNAVDTQRWGIYARAARRVTRHLTVSALASYSQQITGKTTRSPDDFGDFMAVLGFKYDFDTYRF